MVYYKHFMHCTYCLSVLGYLIAEVAQLAEQWYRKPQVAGSIPALGSIYRKTSAKC